MKDRDIEVANDRLIEVGEAVAATATDEAISQLEDLGQPSASGKKC